MPKGKDQPTPRYMLTCDLFFWQEEVSHCFFSWGDSRDRKFKYKEIMVTVHWMDKEEPERLKIFYALHNDQSMRSIDVMIQTALMNLHNIIQPGIF